MSGLSQVMGVLERLDVEMVEVKASHFKTDDLGDKLQAVLGDASLAQHSLASEQPLGASGLVRGSRRDGCSSA